MKIVVKNKPVDCNYLDTYANLLYKAGKVEEAVAWECKAADTAEGIYIGLKETYKKTAQQMKRGEPTWGAIWGYK
jgi:hypothetical protein